MYLLEKDEQATVQLFGSGVILREVIKAAKILRDEYQIHANVWSVTSFNELARDGMACDEYKPFTSVGALPHKSLGIAAVTQYRWDCGFSHRPHACVHSEQIVHICQTTVHT